jgi:hypothetical protein
MEGLGSLLNSLLARQVGMSIHEDPFKNSMDPYGILNTPQAQQVYGPMPMEQAPLNIPLEGSAEELPQGYRYPDVKEEYFRKDYMANQLEPTRAQVPPIQIGNLQFTPNANYSMTEGSYGVPGLKSKIANSYFGGNVNYPFGDTGFSFQGAYGKSRTNENQQYRDYPSQNYTNTSSQFDTGLRYDRQFEPGEGLNSLFK